VTSAGVTAEWLAEAAESANAAPTLAGSSIPVFKAAAFVPYSIEVSIDTVNFASELANLLLDGYDQLTNAAYTTGNGTTAPKGVITAQVAAAPTPALVTSGATDTFAGSDIFKLMNALPSRFQPRAQFCANLSTLNSARIFETGNGAKLFPEMANGQLLGRPYNECSHMKNGISAGAENYFMLYGDFTSAFVIVDRWPVTIEPIDHLFGANRRPTGQRGAFLWARTGSDLVAANALRLLNVT
jgi:HK97 family phage major capsid protein